MVGYTILVVPFILASAMDGCLLAAFKFRRSEILSSVIASALARGAGTILCFRFMNSVSERMSSPFVLSPPSENMIRLKGLAIFLLVNMFLSVVVAQATLRSYRAGKRLVVGIGSGFISFTAVIIGLILALLFHGS